MNGFLVLLMLVGFGNSEDPDYRLTLGGQRFDPLSVAIRADEHEGPDFRLVQFFGRTDREVIRLLEDNGLEIVRYIHPFTYIVWGETDALERTRANSRVRWTGPFLPEYRLLPTMRRSSTDVIAIRVVTYAGAEHDAVAKAFDRLGATSVRAAPLDEKLRGYALSIASDRLPELARLPFVYTVQPVPTDGGNRDEMGAQHVADNMSGGVPIPGYDDWLTTIALDGTGVIMANVDTGVSTSHPDLINRFVPCDGTTCDPDDIRQSGHGTHTAGIMGGDGISGQTDIWGFLRGLGVAPGATMVEQYYPSNYTGEEGMRLLIRESSEAGAVLSNNSWGPSGAALGYELAAMEVDLSVRDAQPDVPGNQPFLFVLAVANGNGGVSSQGTPDDGKNLLSVGSTWLRSQTGAVASVLNNISPNSGHGPARDGRLLPMIVAPGRWVDSPINSVEYGLSQGTSMAAPHIAGAAALFIAQYRETTQARGGTALDPSPELTKAMLMITAMDLEGGRDANGVIMGHRPDNRQGWGRLVLPAFLDPGHEIVTVDRERVLLETGEQWRARFTVDDDSKPLQVMLVWTDAPGHGLGGATPAWNNDLDLQVTYDEETYLGNGASIGGWTQPGGAADERNNAEGVLIGPTATGTFEVTVAATNLTSDGIPGNANLTDQDFALVCVNCQEGASFSFRDNSRFLLTCGMDTADFTIDLDSRGGFSESVTLAVSGLPMGVTADFDQNPVAPDSTVTLTLSGLSGLTAEEALLELTGTAAGWEDSLSLQLVANDGPPAEVTPTVPLDGADRQTRTPLFQWIPVAGAKAYRLELATDAMFGSIVVTETTTGTQLRISDTLAYATEYHWRVTAINGCGDGALTAGSRFTTQPPPNVLLVDDDDNDPDVREAYTTVLDFWGVSYEIWDTNNSAQEPVAGDLVDYDLVIWFSGDAFSSTSQKAGPKTGTEVALAGFLDNGGKLILSSQSYFENMNLSGQPNGFMDLYLGLASVTPSVGYSQVSGLGTFLGGLGSLDLFPPFTNRADVLVGKPGTEPVFEHDGDTVGLLNGANALTLGFPLEGLESDQRSATIPGLLAMLDIQVTNVCVNEAGFFAKLPFWPTSSVADLALCLNAFQRGD